MTNTEYERIYQLETTPEALERSSRYLADHIKPFLSILEPVLICFPDDGPASLGSVFKRAVELCGAIAIFWGPDYRWKELLRLAFDSHANTVIGPPHVLLGLMKLAHATRTPLYVYDAIACGDPFPGWIVKSLKQGLDAMVWGCYAVHSGPVIAGFSCKQEAGIHIREDVFVPGAEQDLDADIPNWGKLRFTYACNPELVFDPEEIGLIQYQPCSCGCDGPRVQNDISSSVDAATRDAVIEKILTWSSVLDLRAVNTESGMSLELIVIPNEQLPEIPSCAHLKIRAWDPETDVPFFVHDHYSNFCEKYR